jgi:branched-subunit amino acid aminotransferase/4-amino-4-deoxychorismate lyase
MKASSVIASFLSGHGGGVYTTMRTVCRSSKIFAYRDHVKRLALVREAIDPSIKDGFDEEATTRLVTPHVRSAILQRLAEKVSGELRISVALRLRDECKTARDATLNDVEVFVAVEELLEARESAVAIEAAVAHRDNPTVKHGAWIEQRKDLEARMRKECNEVIMTDEKGLVTEGEDVSEWVFLFDSCSLLSQG